MKTFLIIAGVVFLILMLVFLWLLIVGADESRRKSKSIQGSQSAQWDQKDKNVQNKLMNASNKLNEQGHP